MHRTTSSAFLVLTTLAACSPVANDPARATATTTDDEAATAVTAPAAQQLAVLDRCSGCGKCARIDPEHFAFDTAARHSLVISDQNLESAALAQAMRGCRDRAIVLQ